MPSFKDALKNYKTNTAASATPPASAEPSATSASASPASSAVVPVNPPEATEILETKTAPEVAGAPEPKAPEPEAKPKRAPRTSKGSSSKPTESTASEATSPAAPYAEGNSLADAIALVSALLPKGASVTITSVHS